MNDRFYQKDDERWYYRTRGSRDAGPFNSRAEAELHLANHIGSWTGKTGSWLRSWRPIKLLRRSATRQG